MDEKDLNGTTSHLDQLKIIEHCINTCRKHVFLSVNVNRIFHKIYLGWALKKFQQFLKT